VAAVVIWVVKAAISKTPRTVKTLFRIFSLLERARLSFPQSFVLLGTAKKSDNGSVAIQFGGCDGKIPNYLRIVAGWNYMVRLYRPHPEILNGIWKFPTAQSIN
jgi:hypothetical protein